MGCRVTILARLGTIYGGYTTLASSAGFCESGKGPELAIIHNLSSLGHTFFKVVTQPCPLHFGPKNGKMVSTEYGGCSSPQTGGEMLPGLGAHSRLRDARRMRTGNDDTQKEVTVSRFHPPFFVSLSRWEVGL